MNILIDARMAGIKGGHGRYLRELINGIAKLYPDGGGFNFTILVKTEDKQLFINLGKNFYLLAADFHWYGVEEQRKLRKILEFLKPDLAHFPHWNIPYFYKEKFIVTIHDLIPIHHPTHRATTKNFFTYGVKYMAMKGLIKKAVKDSKLIITPTKFVQDDIIENFKNIDGVKNKIKVIYEGSSINFIGNKTTANPIFRDKPYFLYVGTAYPHKNLEFLVRTFFEWKAETNSKNMLILIGEDTYFYKKLKNTIKTIAGKNALNEKIANDIKILNSVSDGDLAGAYKNAFAFVFPSYDEGFGLPPLEAMKNNVLTITSEASCMKEVLEDSVIYFNPQVSQTLKKAFDAACDLEPQERAQMIQKGQAQAAKYDWRNTVTQTFEAYKKILK